MFKLFTVFLFLFYTSQAFAQLSYGLKGGIAIVNNKIVSDVNSGFSDSENRFSYQFGIFGSLYLSEKFDLTSELLISDKGSKDNSISYHYNYINLPILAEYKLSNKLSVQAGPEFGYLLSAIIKDGSGSVNSINGGGYNRFDLGAIIGMKYALSDKLSLDLRFIKQLTSLINNIDLRDEAGVLLGSAKIINKVIQLNLAYRLEFDK